MKLKLLILSALIALLPVTTWAGQDEQIFYRDFVGEKFLSLDGLWQLQDLDIEYMRLQAETIRYLDPIKYEQAAEIIDDYTNAQASGKGEVLSFLVPYLSPLDFFGIDTINHQVVDLENSSYDALASVFQIRNIRDFDSDSYLTFSLYNQGYPVLHMTIAIIDDSNIAITFHPDAMSDRDLVVRGIYSRIR